MKKDKYISEFMEKYLGAIKTAYNPKGLWFFGSRVSGQPKEESDIDLVGRSVLPRVKAERNYSFAHRFEESFDDMHLVWAAICSMLAMGAATALLLSFVHQAAQPESLAALEETVSYEVICGIGKRVPRVYK